MSLPLLGAGPASGGLAPPAAPTGLTPTVLSSSSISLTWTDPAGTLTSFDGRYRIGAGAWTTVLGISKPWVLTGLAASTTYGFEVRANSAAGAGAWSDEATATTQDVISHPMNFGGGSPNLQSDLAATWPQYA